MTDTQPDQVPSGDNVFNLPARVRDDPKRAIADLVREHPALVVAGGIAIGAAIAAMLPKGTTRKLATKAAGMAEIAGAAGVALGKSAMERAEATGETLREQGEAWSEHLGEHMGSAARRARALGDEAAQRVERAVAPAGKAAASAGHNLVDRVANLALRRRH